MMMTSNLLTNAYKRYGMNKLRSIRFRQALTQLIIEGLKDNTRRLTTDRQYDVGEVLAISEAYGFIYRGLPDVEKQAYLNRLKRELDCEDPTRHPGWENKLYVRPELMQHRIEIIEKRNQLLQDISDADIMREGIVHGDVPCRNLETGEEGDYTWIEIKRKRLANGKYHVHIFHHVHCNPREAFADMFNSICGKGTWESNPPVVAYTFKLLSKNDERFVF